MQFPERQGLLALSALEYQPEGTWNQAGEVSAGAQEMRDMLKVILKPSGPHSQGYTVPPAPPPKALSFISLPKMLTLLSW